MFSHFDIYPNLVYGFSDRSDGSMHRYLEKENRNRYFRDVDIDPHRVVTADVVHGTSVARVAGADAGTMVKADGLVTNEKNLFLSATASDCFLVYLYDPIAETIGMVHAGWRSIVGGVVGNAVGELAENGSVSPENILAGISPGIGKCHFEISSRDGEKFKQYQDFISERDGKVFVDLLGIVKNQLMYSGFLEKHIEHNDFCTYCGSQNYFSYRRDKPKEVQPMLGYIGVV